MSKNDPTSQHPCRTIAWSALLMLTPTMACISLDSGVIDATEGCDEFTNGTSFDNMSIDTKVRAFMVAAREFSTVSAEVKEVVKVACIDIASDLGGNDTWSELEGDAVLANGKGDGACEVAISRIHTVMDAGIKADANFALLLSPGECYTDFEAQAECDTNCAAQKVCDSGSVETRCEPAELVVECEASCELDAYCIGTVDVAANCMGECEATCVGECKGTCITSEGKKTESDPNCNGKCSAACNGTCQGKCRINVSSGVECGAEVDCKGGCSGEYTEPRCATIYTRPKCTIDTECYESCSARIAAEAKCDPPHVELFCDLSATADIEILVATINDNLPELIGAAEAHGAIILQAAEKLVSAGVAVVQASGDLDGKSIACASAAAQASSDATAGLHVSVDASASVTNACRSNSQ